MACLMMDSFGHYTIGQITRKWDTVDLGASTLVTNVPLHPGSASVLSVPNASGGSYVMKSIAATQTLIAGGYFRWTALTSATGTFIEFLESGTIHVDIRTSTTGKLVVTRNGTVLATSTNTLLADTWYHVEAKVKIDNTTGTYEVRVNGSATNWIPAATGADTQNAGTATANQVKFRGAGTNQYTLMSSVYILDTTGSVAIDFLGPCRVAVLRPAGVGNYAQWTPNYAGNFVNVGEEIADDDNSFNQSSTANQIDSFPLTELPSGATVHAVQYNILTRQDAGAARTIAPLTRISSTDYAGTSYNTSASYGYDRETLTISPATSAQWTVSEVNGAEFGYKLIA